VRFDAELLKPQAASVSAREPLHLWISSLEVVCRFLARSGSRVSIRYCVSRTPCLEHCEVPWLTTCPSDNQRKL